MKKYKVITAPFYCTKLDKVFKTNQIVEIQDRQRAKELVDAHMLKEVNSNEYE